MSFDIKNIPNLAQQSLHSCSRNYSIDCSRFHCSSFSRNHCTSCSCLHQPYLSVGQAHTLNSVSLLHNIWRLANKLEFNACLKKQSLTNPETTAKCLKNNDSSLPDSTPYLMLLWRFII